MQKSRDWFSVDKTGLAKLLGERGMEFVVFELLQNAWDESGTTEVDITLEKIAGTRSVRLTVADDHPNGFATLDHAFTLFAESAKKQNPSQRGRFNLGEKLVLALCSEASIRTTTGYVEFGESGRRSSRGLKTDRGSIFSGVLRMTAADIAQCEAAMQRVIAPASIATRFNGRRLETRTPIKTIDKVTLQTEISDDDGILRRTRRQTTVAIFETDGPGMLFEMGIPVVETGDRWDVDVGQKIPLNFDRDNVPASFLSDVRAAVVDSMSDALTTEDVNAVWARDAVDRHGTEMAPDTIRRIAELRFGQNRVSYDPSDAEANSIAASNGFTVIHGASMSRNEWNAMRQAQAILPAGQVTPSPKPFHPDGRPLTVLPPDNYTKPIKAFVRYAHLVANVLIGKTITVVIANDRGWNFKGAYGHRQLTVNAAAVRAEWFDGPNARINEFLIHEFGHEFAADHLSEKYHDALCKLGGKLSQFALDNTESLRACWNK